MGGIVPVPVIQINKARLGMVVIVANGALYSVFGHFY